MLFVGANLFTRYGLTDEELAKSPLSVKVDRVIALKMSDTDDVVVRACHRIALACSQWVHYVRLYLTHAVLAVSVFCRVEHPFSCTDRRKSPDPAFVGHEDECFFYNELMLYNLIAHSRHCLSHVRQVDYLSMLAELRPTEPTTLGSLTIACTIKSVLTKHTITIYVQSGKNLIAMDTRGTSDPFVVVTIYGGTMHDTKRVKTKVQRRTLNPTWNETLQFEIEATTLDRCDKFQPACMRSLSSVCGGHS